MMNYLRDRKNCMAVDNISMGRRRRTGLFDFLGEVELLRLGANNLKKVASSRSNCKGGTAPPVRISPN